MNFECVAYSVSMCTQGKPLVYIEVHITIHVYIYVYILTYDNILFGVEVRVSIIDIKDKSTHFTTHHNTNVCVFI